MIAGIKYFIRSILFTAAAIVALFVIQTIEANDVVSTIIMIVTFLFIGPEFVKVCDIDADIALFVEDFTSAIVFGIIAFVASMFFANFIHEHVAVFTGLFFIYLAVIKGLDTKKYIDDCAKFSTIIGFLLTAALAIYGIIVICRGNSASDEDWFVNTNPGTLMIVFIFLFWVYTIIAHTIHACDVED